MEGIEKLSDSFRWCISTLGCSELTFNEAVELAGQFAVREIEFRGLEERLDLPEYLSEKFGSPESLKAALDAANIKTPVLDTSFRLVGSTPEDREALLAFVPWAEALEVPYLRVFDGGESSQPASEAALAEAVESVRWWQELRQRNGWQVDIVMETHDAFCGSESCLALESRLAVPCAILWDAHHTFHKAGEPIGETWAALKPFVRHIHFKDSTDTPNAINDYTLAIPGTGRFPLEELFRMLFADGYAGALCLEWERKWQPWVAPLSEALAGTQRVESIVFKELKNS